MPKLQPRKAILAAPILAVAAMAVAYGYGRPSGPCFTAGTTTYRLSTSAGSPDYRVAIDNRANAADLRLSVVDRAEGADFMLIDEPGEQEAACRQARTIEAVRPGAPGARPDMTVSLTDPPAADAFKLYVQSARFSKEDAAALFAVIWKTARRDIAEQR